MIYRIFDKLFREIYRFFHPYLWGKRLQINGVPRILDLKNMNIGMDVSINQDVYIQGSGGVLIGDRVTLSKGVNILTEGLDTSKYTDNAQNKFRNHIKRRVVIGSGTWLAAGVIVCPGVKIAKNSIVAAGAIVSEDLEEDGVLYGGIPARKIKEL